MNCPKCSFFNKEDEVKCQKCGKKINLSPEAIQMRKKIFFISGTCIIIVAIILTALLIFRTNAANERPVLITTIRNYDFTKNFNMVIDAGLYSELRVEILAEGRFDHINRTKFYEADERWFINSPDEQLSEASAYVDFANRTTYFKVPNFEQWVRERTAVPLVNINDFIEAIENDEQLIKVGDYEYRLTISNYRVMEIAIQFTGEILEHIPVMENSFVTLEIRDGLILRATYDFTEIYRQNGVTNFVLIFEFDNHNQTEPVVIPQDVIRNSLALEEIVERARMCNQSFGCQCATPTSPTCHCNYNNRQTGQVFVVQCPNPNLSN